MRLAVIGGYGRMGRRIIELAMEEKDITVSCAVESRESGVVGKKISECFPSRKNNGHGLFTEQLVSDVDVVIDFSSPAATMSHIRAAGSGKMAYVIGTTGFSLDQENEINRLSKKIAIVKSPNMSVGVNLLFMLTKEVSKVLGPLGYDIEIVELHHNKKKDAPSGTALKLLSSAAEGANKDIKDAVYGRDGIVGERKEKEIGVLAVRAGDIIGEHTVYFAGNNERLELTHRAHSRDALARGAITAARFVCSKEPGIYDMLDVLGLKNK
jgi:4-hydroxy-tetrahydrodipicolinate reductase